MIVSGIRMLELHDYISISYSFLTLSETLHQLPLYVTVSTTISCYTLSMSRKSMMGLMKTNNIWNRDNSRQIIPFIYHYIKQNNPLKKGKGTEL